MPRLVCRLLFCVRAVRYLPRTGLGLGPAISRSIVSAHGGSIRAENNAEGGATFRCLLPLSNAAFKQARVISG